MDSEVHVLNHPIVRAKISTLRHAETGPKEFREIIHDISYILGVEASRDIEEDTYDGVSTHSCFPSLTYVPRRAR